MHGKILFLGKSNLNSIISKDLTDSYISLHEFLVNNVALVN